LQLLLRLLAVITDYTSAAAAAAAPVVALICPHPDICTPLPQITIADIFWGCV